MGSNSDVYQWIENSYNFSLREGPVHVKLDFITWGICETFGYISFVKKNSIT